MLGESATKSTPTRDILGTASFNSSSRLPLSVASEPVTPVTFPPGRAKLSMEPGRYRVQTTVIMTMGLVLIPASIAARMTSGLARDDQTSTLSCNS